MYEQALDEDRLVTILDRGPGYLRCHMGVNENLVGKQFLVTVRLSRLQPISVKMREVGHGLVIIEWLTFPGPVPSRSLVPINLLGFPPSG